MNERILRVVEFNKVIEQLMAQTETSLGKEKARLLYPKNTRAAVERRLEETDEALQVFKLDESFPFGGITNVQEAIHRSTIGSILSASECLAIRDTVRGGRRLKKFIEKIEDRELPHLKKYADEIMSLEHLQRKIDECIDEYGEILDSASPTLRGIRSAIRTYEGRIRERLQSFLKSQSHMLQESIVTIRNDRYVIPVKSHYRSAVGGIVHDQSSSGQTLFMEPRGVVDANNDLQESLAQESEEIERILRMLTEIVQEHAEYLENNLDILSELDLIVARASLALEMDASLPKMNEDNFIQMKKARHPLIPENEVVSNDIEIGKDYRAILITGPNTGGKTVTLKLVGLCVLMAQSGLFVPAEEGLELAIFKEVFADIGDEQSIEQNLSTFSSHMTNIVDILEKFDEKSLILFDELGAGTDPQEGAALAIAILDEVIRKKATVIATTHYPELKAYGYNREEVVNASVEFDVETLKPTYRLLLGIPGRSNAFEISQRLGLSTSIINNAKQQIDSEVQGVESMITSLDEARKSAEKDYEEAEIILEQANELKAELDANWNDFERFRDDLYKLAEEKADEAIRKAKVEAEEIVAEVREMRGRSSVKEHEWIAARKRLEEAHPDLVPNERESVPKSKEDDTLQVGDEVKFLQLNREGIIAEVVGKDEYMVEVGVMKVRAKRNQLEFIKRQEQNVETSVTRTKGTKSYVPREIDLRGNRYTEAVEKIDKYIDDSLLAGHNEVTIIHGKGTGVLRKGVQEYLQTHCHVKSLRDGEYGEGDKGVTVIELQ